MVNVASACGYTNQHYSELQWIFEHDDFRDKLNILAFPCNQFGQQEQGSPQQIEKVARQVYKTTFPLFMKIDVIGENAHPIYKYLAGRGYNNAYKQLSLYTTNAYCNCNSCRVSYLVF